MRRGRQVRTHLMVGLLVLLVLIPVNFVASPRNPWWMWGLTAWVPLIAGHYAWALGLFERNRKGS